MNILKERSVPLIDMEDSLQQNETLWAPLVKRLDEGQFTLSELERADVACFVATLLVRSPCARRMANKMTCDNALQSARELASAPGKLEDLFASTGGLLSKEEKEELQKFCKR